MDLAKSLQHARALAARADDRAAQAAYVDVLRREPTHLLALTELGNLALAGGFRSAARTAYLEAVKHHPGDPIARVNLANVLRQDTDVAGAKLHYEAALALDPELHEAHQGMAWALADSDPPRAERHWHKGFSGHALVSKPYRGMGVGVPLLLLVSARGGNIPTQLWIDDRRFTVHALYAEFYDFRLPLPAHALIVNAIGDADLCQVALARAAEVLAGSAAPVINRPQRVAATGRAAIARRLGAIPGVIAPRIDTLSPAAILAAAEALVFPLLLRRPGFHTGEHFLYVAERADLPEAVASLQGPTPQRFSPQDSTAQGPSLQPSPPQDSTAQGPSLQPSPPQDFSPQDSTPHRPSLQPSSPQDSTAQGPSLHEQPLLLISYLDARGPDGMSRKYRVMFIDGVAYPLHLAISTDWKVHYFSANMAENPAHRDEERRFLEDMPAALGATAMAALEQICTVLGLEYAGIDFALAADGAVLLFEANATMVVFPPGPEAIWDYRRRAIDEVLAAATRMLMKYARSA